MALVQPDVGAGGGGVGDPAPDGGQNVVRPEGVANRGVHSGPALVARVGAAHLHPLPTVIIVENTCQWHFAKLHCIIPGERDALVHKALNIIEDGRL